MEEALFVLWKVIVISLLINLLGLNDCVPWRSHHREEEQQCYHTTFCLCISYGYIDIHLQMRHFLAVCQKNDWFWILIFNREDLLKVILGITELSQWPYRQIYWGHLVSAASRNKNLSFGLKEMFCFYPQPKTRNNSAVDCLCPFSKMLTIVFCKPMWSWAFSCWLIFFIIVVENWYQLWEKQLDQIHWLLTAVTAGIPSLKVSTYSW